MLDEQKVTCGYCAKRMLPRKLVVHLRYFCGPDAERSEKLRKRDRNQDVANEKAMATLKITGREGAGGATAQLSPNGGAAPRVPPQQRRASPEDPPNGAAQQLTSSPPRAEATVEPGGAAALRASAPHGASAAQHAAAANQQPGELLVDAGMDDMD